LTEQTLVFITFTETALFRGIFNIIFSNVQNIDFFLKSCS